MAQILMVVTAADALPLADGTQHPTGFWAEELVVSHRDLVAAGHHIDIVTPAGAAAPVDQGSLAPEAVGTELSADLTAYLETISEQLQHPGRLEDVDPQAYDAVLMPGGHGPMADLYRNEALGTILTDADARGAVIAPFCHGPAGLLSAKTPAGGFLFAGRELTAFTDAEERAGGLAEKMSWLLETSLREQGATFVDGPAWGSHVVVDRNLVTGQNPASSAAVAEAVADLLR